jgi:Uma2 family endonuclease
MAGNAPIALEDDGRICEMGSRRAATVEDLYHAEDKAELVAGELLVMPASGGLHGFAAGEVFASLHAYARRTKSGYAIGDSVGFLVSLPNRRSFCPDGGFWTGAPPTRRFYEGAPVFALEVRSEEDYGPVAERAMAAKRADYFAAGTLVVWDVDVLRDRVVYVYRASDPLTPTVYRRGDRAGAEPAVPGWTLAVSDLFPDDEHVAM